MLKHGVLFLSCFLCGCGEPTLFMTYHSDPPGATLYQANKSYMYTPVTLYYTIAPEDQDRGYIVLQPASVRWISGASASTNSITVDLSKGANQTFTFIRPKKAKELDTDIQFFLELRRQKIMQEKADAQDRENASRAIYYALQQNQMQNEHRQKMQELQNLQSLQMMQQHRPYHCTTRQSGRNLVTDCL